MNKRKILDSSRLPGRRRNVPLFNSFPPNRHITPSTLLLIKLYGRMTDFHRRLGRNVPSRDLLLAWDISIVSHHVPPDKFHYSQASCSHFVMTHRPKT